MKIQFKILIVSLITTVLFTGLLNAEERDREGAFAGVFLDRAEHWLGDRQYLAVIVKPLESDDRVTILVPRNEDFMQVARELREGDKVEIGFVREVGQKWLKRIDIERELKGPEREKRRIETKELELIVERLEMAEKMERLHARIAELKEAAEQAARDGHHDKADQLRQEAKMLSDKLITLTREIEEIKAQNIKQQIIHLKDSAREAKQRGELEKAENLRAHADELERMLKRDLEHPEMKKPPLEHQPQIPPLLPHKVPPIEEQLNSIRIQLKEAFAHQLQKMREQLKEVVGDRLERMTGGFEELSMRVDKLERELRDLRAENQRLRSQLDERRRPIREPDRQERQLRRDSDERPEERQERELIEQREGDRDRAERAERRPPGERDRDDNDEDRE